MKVLQIINSFNMGGAEKLVIEMTPLFFKNNVNIDTLILKSTKSELENSVNFKFDTLSKLSFYNPINILLLIFRVRKYDVIHMHLFPTLYLVTLAKYLAFSKAKLVYTEHSSYNKRRNNIFFKFLDNFIYSLIDQIITISEEVDKNFRKEFSNDNVSLIFNGVNLDKYRNATQYSKEDFFEKTSKILIQVSSFRYPKDQKTVIDALELLPENYCLLLVGEGPLKNDVTKYVESKNLLHRVEFLGNRNDVDRLLKTADFVILSSAYEGMSLSSIEGMCAGKPFISSDVPGLTSIVKDYGILFTLKDSKQLKDIIIDLDNNEVYKAEVINKCYLRSNQFSLETTVDGYSKIYKKLCLE